MYYYGKTCTKITKKLPNGIEKLQNKGMLMISIAWGLCIERVKVFLKTILKLPNGIEKAAEQGNAKAQHNLGFMYLCEGVNQRPD